MARIRTVKPELFRHEELHQAEVETGLPLRLAFIGLFTCCDREGRFEWRPQRLKLDILPYDEVDIRDVLIALSDYRFIEHYEVDGKSYGHIPSFLNHQVINQREAQSKIPEPPECTETHVHAHEKQGGAYQYRGVNIAPALAETIFARDGRKCCRCPATEDLTIDHIFPRSLGGTHAPANLRVMCRPCNSGRPVSGQALIDDLASDGYTLDDMQRTCMHVQAHGEVEGNMEGEGKGKEVKDSRPASHPDQPAKANGHGEAVQEVFSYWCQVMGKNSLTKLTKDRKAKIEARLKEGYNVDHIKQAIDGCASSPHHMGQNDAGTVYDDLTLICRTGSKLEWFAKSVGSKQPVTKGGPETMDQFMERNRAQAERVMASGMLDDLPPERD